MLGTLSVNFNGGHHRLQSQPADESNGSEFLFPLVSEGAFLPNLCFYDSQLVSLISLIIWLIWVAVPDAYASYQTEKSSPFLGSLLRVPFPTSQNH